MNSLLITDTFLPRIGGRENYYHHLFTNLPPQNRVIITPDRTGSYQEFDSDYPLPIYRIQGLSQKWFKWGRPGRVKWLKHLINICWKYEIKSVHCGLILPDGLSGWLLRQTLGLPYIIYGHGKELLENQQNPETAKLMRLVLDAASRVVSVSEYTENIFKNLGVSPEKLVKISPGVMAEKWGVTVPREQIDTLRHTYHLENRPVILTVGRLIERKGHDIVIQAMPSILSRVPDAAYLIVGNGPDKPRLEALRNQLGLETAVIFTGEVPDAELLAYYKLATVFTMVSRQPPGTHEVEGFGIVYLEANASGLPVVAGHSGGVPDAVADGKTGYLVDPLSVEAVAASLVQLLENPGLCQQLGNGGRQRVIEEFSWVYSSAKLQQLITEVVQETPRRSCLDAAFHTLPLMLRHHIF